MSIELKRITEKLATGGFKVASDEIDTLIASLTERGLLPNQLSDLDRKKHYLDIKIANNINNEIGSKLPDNYDIRNLSPESQRMARAYPDSHMYKDLQITKPPTEWLEITMNLSVYQRSVIYRIINSLSRSGNKQVGKIRESSIDYLTTLRNISTPSAEFAKAMFAKKEE